MTEPFSLNQQRDVLLHSEPVELYKLLKFEGLVGSGGESRHVIAEGLVKVNGEIEMRKRKKLVAGDEVEFNGEILKLIVET